MVRGEIELTSCMYGWASTIPLWKD